MAQQHQADIHLSQVHSAVDDPSQGTLEAVGADGVEVVPGGDEGFELADVSADPMRHRLVGTRQLADFVQRVHGNRRKRRVRGLHLAQALDGGTQHGQWLGNGLTQQAPAQYAERQPPGERPQQAPKGHLGDAFLVGGQAGQFAVKIALQGPQVLPYAIRQREPLPRAHVGQHFLSMPLLEPLKQGGLGLGQGLQLSAGPAHRFERHSIDLRDQAQRARQHRLQVRLRFLERGKERRLLGEQVAAEGVFGVDRQATKDFELLAREVDLMPLLLELQ